jgi:2,3-bisphosphoglycerate-dependent phosphoglycerate mutase
VAKNTACSIIRESHRAALPVLSEDFFAAFRFRGFTIPYQEKFLMLNNPAWAKRWLLAPLALLPLICLVALGYYFYSSPVTTIIIVRHAEKNIEPNNPNPSLSADGIVRSQTLLHVLGESSIKAIYTSQFFRTQQTAQPLAERLNLTATQVDAKDARGLVNGVLANHRGEVVLIVGHTNSIPQIIEALGGGAIPEIPETQYDNLFVVTLKRFGKPQVVKLKYGNPS